jgi:hypothetical protein
MKTLKVSFFLVLFLIFSQTSASADFSGDFAPAKWPYQESDSSEYGPSASLTPSTMQITSANWSSGAVTGTFGQYGIEIPWYLKSITFEYSYVTGDVDGSFFDMASYTLNGAKTNFVASNIPQFESASGSVTLDVSSLAGKSLLFTQACTDCVLGSATISIRNFSAISRSSLLNAHELSSQSNPVLTKDEKGYTCKPGAYTLKRFSFAKEQGSPTSLRYTLIVDGKRTSSLSTDNWSTFSKPTLASTGPSLIGSASADSAFWASTSSIAQPVQCEVLAFQDSATSLNYSNTLG